jgi:hypothetical protein
MLQMLVAWTAQLASMLHITQSELRDLHAARQLLELHTLDRAAGSPPAALQHFFVIQQEPSSGSCLGGLQLRFVLSSEALAPTGAQAPCAACP